MGKNQDYKNRALASLEGKWSNGIIATLIVLLIGGCVGQGATMFFDITTGYGISGIWYLICLPLSWGGIVYFLNLIRNEDIAYERLFDGYKDFVRIFLALFPDVHLYSHRFDTADYSWYYHQYDVVADQFHPEG